MLLKISDAVFIKPQLLCCKLFLTRRKKVKYARSFQYWQFCNLLVRFALYLQGRFLCIRENKLFFFWVSSERPSLCLSQVKCVKRMQSVPSSRWNTPGTCCGGKLVSSLCYDNGSCILLYWIFFPPWTSPFPPFLSLRLWSIRLYSGDLVVSLPLLSPESSGGIELVKLLLILLLFSSTSRIWL